MPNRRNFVARAEHDPLARGQCHGQQAARHEMPAAGREHLANVRQVFQHVAQRQNVEALGRVQAIGKPAAAHPPAELDRLGSHGPIGLDAQHIGALPPGLVEQPAVTAADVAKPCARQTVQTGQHCEQRSGIFAAQRFQGPAALRLVEPGRRRALGKRRALVSAGLAAPDVRIFLRRQPAAANGAVGRRGSPGKFELRLTQRAGHGGFSRRRDRRAHPAARAAPGRPDSLQWLAGNVGHVQMHEAQQGLPTQHDGQGRQHDRARRGQHVELITPDPMHAAVAHAERDQHQPDHQVDRGDVEVAQKVIVEQPLEIIAQVAERKTHERCEHRKAALFVAIPGFERHVGHHRPQRIEPEQHVRLEKITPADLLQGQSRERRGVNRGEAVRRVEQVPVAAGHFRQQRQAGVTHHSDPGHRGRSSRRKKRFPLA